MIDQGLTYYVPYESFTFLELLYSLAHRHGQKGYQIGMFKNKKEGDASEPKFEAVLDYSPNSIIQVFAVLVN